MNEISYIFLTLHLVSWVFLILIIVEIHSMKKELRMYVDYESSIRKKRKEIRSKK
jgi:hypothetical protein